MSDTASCEITVRPAVPGDKEQMAEVSALATATLRETYRPTEGALRQRPRHKFDMLCLVALLNRRIVGTARCQVADGRFHLIGLGVHPGFQRRGVARRIIECAQGLARGQGLAALTGWVLTAMCVAAIAIWLRDGVSFLVWA